MAVIFPSDMTVAAGTPGGTKALCRRLTAHHQRKALPMDLSSQTSSQPTCPVSLTINGEKRSLEIHPWVSLLDLLRGPLELTGTKKGCDHGQCGACTVLVNGKRVNACLTLAVMHEGDKLTTIEGLASGDQLHPVQEAFIKHDGFQCGYCTSGQIMSAVGLLREGKHCSSRAEISEFMSGNICRCGAYPNIVSAIEEVKNSGQTV